MIEDGAHLSVLYADCAQRRVSNVLLEGGVVQIQLLGCASGARVSDLDHCRPCIGWAVPLRLKAAPHTDVTIISNWAEFFTALSGRVIAKAEAGSM